MEFIDPMAVKEKNKGDMMYSESRFLGHYLFEKPDFQLKKITGFYIDILDYTDTEPYPCSSGFGSAQSPVSRSR